MNFAERLAMLRRAKDVPLKEVAGYLKISVGTMSNYETGVHQPDFGTLCRLADYYGVSIDYLLGRGNCLGQEKLSNQQDMLNHRQNPPQGQQDALLTLREKIYFETGNLSENNLRTLERLVNVMKKYEIYVEKKH